MPTPEYDDQTRGPETFGNLLSPFASSLDCVRVQKDEVVSRPKEPDNWRNKNGILMAVRNEYSLLHLGRQFKSVRSAHFDRNSCPHNEQDLIRRAPSSMADKTS